MAGRHREDFNTKFFEVIDTEAKAYMLGMMASDGNIHDTRISLTMTDLDVIEQFVRCLGHNNEIKTIEWESRKLSPQYKKTYRFSFRSAKMVSDLGSHGVTSKKSMTVGFPDIDKSLIRHYVRGIFDGDGCLYVSKQDYMRCQLTCASRELIIGYLIYLDGIGASWSMYSKPNLTKSIEVAGSSARILLEDIYRDSTVFMERKYRIFSNYRDRRWM